MSAIDRRRFLSTSVGGFAAAALSTGLWNFGDQNQLAAAPTPPTKPDTLFLTWQRDPTTTMTVQWIGAPAPAAEPLTIGYSERGKNNWNSLAPSDRPYPMTDLRVFRSELTGLTPGTEYELRIGDRSPVHRFRTMPAKATDAFHFISGGDCGIDAHAVANNVAAAKQDPMFALIGGDLGYDDGRKPDVSLQFMRNYSQHMIDSQGRLIPMVVCIGNHEVNGGYNKTRADGPFFFALHDGLYAERSFATLDFGDYLSLVLLDTGHVAPIGGEQTDWLDKTLADRADHPHLIVVNHVPAYPSIRSSRTTGKENRDHWVPLFEKHNVDLVLEHHDHHFKRTHPLKGGLTDGNGILYLGDGSWGKLRPPGVKFPESRPYMAATHQDYHLTLHRLEGEQRFHMAMAESGKIVDICRTTKKPRQRKAS